MKIILLALMFSCLSFGELQAMTSTQEVELINAWSGKTRDETHKDAGPENKIVTDKKTWAELWKKWKPDEELPEIDFGKDFVLVQTAFGPNQVIISGLKVEDGKLTFQAGSSRMGGPGFGFKLLQISRAGIVSVKDTPLPEPADQEMEDSETEEVEFKSLTVKTTGGIAGLMQIEKITKDGKIVVESTVDGSKTNERQLTVEQIEDLLKHVVETDWSKVPADGGNDTGVSDGMQHVIEIETSARKYEFSYGSIKAQQVAELKKLLRLVAGQKPR